MELSKVEPLWFEYVNNSMKPDLFKTDIRSIIGQSDEIDVVFEDRIKDVVTSDDRTTKDIGNLGEAIICGHEKMRLKSMAMTSLSNLSRLLIALLIILV